MFERFREELKSFLKSRLLLPICLFIAIGVVLIVRIFNLQIIKGEEFVNNYELKIIREKSIDGIRGNIYDRNGYLLAYNVLSYDVNFEDVIESGKSKNMQLNNTIYEHDLLPDGAGDSSKAAAIRLSEDGTQVLCSNRGHDSISVFNADPDTGHMERINVAKLGGKFPRDFQFMPGGKFVIAGLKESWRVASYAYDAATGAFEEAARIDGIYRPLFFAFKTR